MATTARDPNYRMVRAVAQQGMHGAGRVGGGGGGGNPLSSLAASSDEEPVRSPFHENSVQFQERHAAWSAAHQQQQMQQDVGAAITTMAQVYAQTGDQKRALTAMIRQHPQALGEMVATGMLKSPKDLAGLMASGTPQGQPSFITGPDGQTYISNPGKYGNTYHPGMRPPTPPDPDKHAKPVVVNGKLVWSTPDNPTGEGREIGPAPEKAGKAMDAKTKDVLSSIPSAYKALAAMNELNDVYQQYHGQLGGGAATGAIAAIGAKYGVGTTAQQIIQSSVASLHTAIDSGALGTRYAGIVKKWEESDSPQAIFSKSYNSVLAQTQMNTFRDIAQSRAGQAEQDMGHPMSPDMAKSLWEMGVRTQGLNPDMLLQGKHQFTGDELETLGTHFRDQMTPQHWTAFKAQVDQLSGGAGTPNQRPAGGKGTMPSQQQVAPQPQQDTSRLNDRSPANIRSGNSALPPDTPINSKGQPYSASLNNMPADQKAGQAASYAAIKNATQSGMTQEQFYGKTPSTPPTGASLAQPPQSDEDANNRRSSIFGAGDTTGVGTP